MNCLSKTLIILVLTSTVSIRSFAEGIPTIDVAAIGQMVLQMKEMQRQYDQMLAQYQELIKQNEQLIEITSKLEGFSGLEELLRNESELDLWPELEGIDLSDFSIEKMPAGAMQIYQNRGFAANCSTKKAAAQEECQKRGAFLATNEYLYQQAITNNQKRVNQINSLIDAIKNCKTAKEAADLQSRIQGEMALIQASQIKTQLIKSSLDSAMQAAKEEEKNRINTFLFN